MKKLILTSAFILGSVISLFAQANKPGTPIGGIIVKGGKAEASTGGNVSPLYDASGDAKTNPVVNTGDVQASVTGSPIGGIVVKGGKTEAASVDGNPIGGIIVKGGKAEPAAVTTNPLYSGSGSAASNPLYKEKD